MSLVSGPPTATLGENVQKLVDMGFDQQQATNALRKYNNHMEKAINWLFAASDSSHLATKSPSPRSNQPQQQQQPQYRNPNPNLNPNPNPTGPVSHSANNRPHSSNHIQNIASPSAMSLQLPPGYYRGMVKKFFEMNKERVPGSGFGFIEPELNGFQGDIYFQWKNVLSTKQSWPPPPHSNLIYAVDNLEEFFVQPGDIVVYRIAMQHGFVTKDGTTSSKPHAVEVKVIELNSKVKYRKSQQAYYAGENMPMNAFNASGASSSVNSALAQPPPPANTINPVNPVPTQPFKSLVGQRLKGIIHQLSAPDPPSSSMGARGTKPHGFLSAHHIECASVFFFLEDFKETRHAASQVASSAQPITLTQIAQSFRSRIFVGDVVEFTLDWDAVVGACAKELVIVPTLTYGQVEENARKQRLQDNVGLSGPLATLVSGVPLIYIQGAHLEEDESRHLEFKSLTRSSNTMNMQRTFLLMADKYMNSFLNSQGGIILFGVEDNGLVAGLQLDKKDRDHLRISVDGFMSSSTPPVGTDRYTFRFVPVHRLYKSSWCGPNGTAGGASLGMDLFRIESQEVMIKSMFQPEQLDRVEDTHLFVIAIITAPGDPDVIYQTSGHYQPKDSYQRRDGSSVRMAPVDIAQRLHERRNAKNTRETQIDELLKSIQQQLPQQPQPSAAVPTPTAVAPASQPTISPEMMASIVKEVEARLKADIAAAANAGSSSSRSTTPRATAPASSSSASSSNVTGGTAASPSSSGDDFQVPSQLLSVLQSMSFPRAAILDACYELHESGEVDFKTCFRTDSTEQANSVALDKVLNLLIAKLSSPTPTTINASTANPTNEDDRLEGEPHHPHLHVHRNCDLDSKSNLSASPQSVDDAMLSAFTRTRQQPMEGVQDQPILALPPPTPYQPEGGNPLASAPISKSISPPHGLFQPSHAAASITPSSSSLVIDDRLPCEVCHQLFSVDNLDPHQRACHRLHAAGVASSSESHVHKQCNPNDPDDPSCLQDVEELY